MSFPVTKAAVATLALMALAGCNSKDKVGGSGSVATTNAASTTTQQQQTPPASADSARRITTVELDDALKRGQAIVVDVRNDAAFKQGHIRGAILIPSTEIGNRLNELPRDKMIVTYCS